MEKQNGRAVIIGSTSTVLPINNAVYVANAVAVRVVETFRVNLINNFVAELHAKPSSISRDNRFIRFALLTAHKFERLNAVGIGDDENCRVRVTGFFLLPHD